MTKVTKEQIAKDKLRTMVEDEVAIYELIYLYRSFFYSVSSFAFLPNHNLNTSGISIICQIVIGIAVVLNNKIQ